MLPNAFLGLLVIGFFLLTSGRQDDKDAALGYAVFYAKALVVVIGLILLANVIR